MIRGSSVCAACALVLALACAASVARSGETAPAADDPQLEARVQRVAEELRCLVCQNQTIADSNADLAKDLRAEVRRLLAQGGSEAEVREFMVNRYGDFILYRPPLKATTLMLWVGPFALLALALWIHRRSVARRERSAAGATLTEAEQARLRALVGSDQGPERG